jgi:hypothetical protein
MTLVNNTPINAATWELQMNTTLTRRQTISRRREGETYEFSTIVFSFEGSTERADVEAALKAEFHRADPWSFHWVIKAFDPSLRMVTVATRYTLGD